MKQILNKIKVNYKLIFILYLFLTLFATAQSYFKPESVNGVNGKFYTHYNNYVIFKQSYFHLLEGKDLYQIYPEEQWDLYKYSPAFALFFGLFSYLPDLLGLLLWNLLNTLVLLFSIRYLPQLNTRSKALILLSISIELLTALQNEQSNALTAGLIILVFCFLERKNYLWAACCIVLSIYIKLFGVVALALYIFYPQKWKLALYTATWSMVLFFLPLIITGLAEFQFQYKSWFNMLANDHSVSYGFSVMGWLKTWFNLEPSKIAVMLTGAILFNVPFVRFQQYQHYSFRLLALASVLIWVVIFNHKAESPTFIIAITGVAIWYFSQERKPENLVLFVIAIIFTSLAPTDIFPRFIRVNYFRPYVVKVVPCMLVWLKVLYEMTVTAFKPELLTTKTEDFATIVKK